MLVNEVAERLSKMQAFLLLRYTLIAATAYLVLVEDRFVIPPLGMSLLIAAALTSNVLAGWLPSRVLNSMSFAAAVIIADTAWITAALICSGHFSPDFFYLYFFVLLLAAMGENLGLIAVGAVVVCAAYVYVLSATGGTWSLWNSPSIIRLPFLFTAAAFYGYMVDRMRREERRVAAMQQAANAREEFFASVSHEIRTPTHGVLGWTQLLLDTELGGEQREYAERIRRAGQSLLAIINDILDASKIEAAKVELEVNPFDLRDTVADAVEQLAESAQRKDLELAYRVDPAVPATVRGDGSRLAQVLTNLVGNAIKFTARGEVVVRVTRAKETDTSVLVRCEVADTGIGVPAEQRDRIFERFSQADPSTSRKYGGTGLGLTISLQLVKLMGGEIGVTSQPGSFWFTVRMGREPSRAAQPRRSTRLAPRRILIVDDNASLRDILNDQVRAWGMRSEAVADAPTALDLLRAAEQAGDPYAMAIIDVRLPCPDGLGLARAIRADPALAGMGLVLLAPMTQRDSVDTVRPGGPTATLGKPLRPARLFDCLERLAGTPEPETIALAAGLPAAFSA